MSHLLNDQIFLNGSNMFPTKYCWQYLENIEYILYENIEFWHFQIELNKTCIFATYETIHISDIWSSIIRDQFVF